MRLRLTRHPDFRCAAVTDITVDVARPRADMLQLIYSASGSIGDVRVPPATTSARTDDLWKHTCFEVFLADGEGYFEFNFSPSMQWAAYRFSGYRAGMTNADVQAPSIEAHADSARLELRASLTLPAASKHWRLGLSAVIEETSGDKSYWALAHAPGKPDFHHADTFAADAPLPEQT